jgi:hypothetical protein
MCWKVNVTSVGWFLINPCIVLKDESNCDKVRMCLGVIASVGSYSYMTNQVVHLLGQIVWFC